jgi:phage-related protein (TIGR01555 family)
MLFNDGPLLNLISGLGTQKDKLSHARFNFNYLTRFDLDAMYEGDWVAGTAIDAPCDDMTREWRIWNAGPRHTAEMASAERRLRVRQRVNQALKLARLYGGSAILLGTGDENPALPLIPESIKRGGLKYLHVLSRYEIFTEQLDRDPMSEFFGEPLMYSLARPNNGAILVHPSRIVRFLGQARLELSRTIDGWGLSTLQRMYDAIRNVSSTSNNLASLVYEAKVDVIKIPGLTENAQDPTYQANVLARFAIANMGKSIQSAVVLDKEEEWAHKTVTFGGLVEVLREFLQIAAGAADIPITRFLGTSAKGLNASGEEDTRNYYDALSSKQEIEIRPAMERLDEALIRSALGSRPDSVDYSWAPLWQMTAAQSAAIDLQIAQTAQIYAALGVLPPSAMRKGITARLIENNTYPGLQDAINSAGAEVPAPLIAPSAEVDTNAPKPIAAKP